MYEENDLFNDFLNNAGAGKFETSRDAIIQEAFDLEEFV